MDAAANSEDFVAAVRRGDYERFLAIQLAPAAKRPALYAITAFQIEIASIAELVSEPLVGHIRLAWWREALEQIEAGRPPRNHPVVLALAEIHRRQPSVFAFLHEMTEARAADLDATLLEDEPAWRDYCNHTAGALHMAFAYVLDEACARANETTIRDGGRAYAMIGLARAIPYMAAPGMMRLPKIRLAKHGLASLAPSPALDAMVEEIIKDAVELIPSKRYNQKLQVLNALVALTILGKRQLERVSANPYRLNRRKLRAVWQLMLLKHCRFTCF